MRKLLAAVAIIIVGGLAAWYFTTRQGAQPPASTTMSSTTNTAPATTTTTGTTGSTTMSSTASTAPAAPANLEKLTLQLKWVTQAQFAGYYVAKEKGFYKDVGLDVDIKPGGPDINPSQVIGGGGADVVIDWMPSALATREKGIPLVNIAQPFQKSGMELTCRKETGITQPQQFKGH